MEGSVDGQRSLRKTKMRNKRIINLLLVLIGILFLISCNDVLQGDEKPEKMQDLSRSTEEEMNNDYDTRKATVIRVYDGDTFKVQFHGDGSVAPVRIKGIDCPETSRDVDKCWDDSDRVELSCPEQVPLGKKVTRIAREKMEGKTVRLESYDRFKRDQHNRVLAFVRHNGEDYGLSMVKQGYCRAFGDRFKHPRSDEYLQYDRPLEPLDH